MALRNHWSRHDRCCWGRTGFQQLGGGAGRAGTCAVYRPLLARLGFQLQKPMSSKLPALRLLVGAFVDPGSRDIRMRSPSLVWQLSRRKACHVWQASVCSMASSSAVSARAMRSGQQHMSGAGRVKRAQKSGEPEIWRTGKIWLASRQARQPMSSVRLCYGAGFEATAATTLDSFWRFDSTGFS